MQLMKIIKKIHFEIVTTIANSIDGKYVPKIHSEENKLEGDVSYDIDFQAEHIILKNIQSMSIDYTIHLVMEGLSRTEVYKGNKGVITIIFDPIDGTREIMYNKRSAWVLTGIAFKTNPKLCDIEIAVQTEIPTLKQDKLSHIFAFAGEGAFEEIYDKKTFERINTKKRLSSSPAKSFTDGYISFPNPFPGTKVAIAQIHELFCSKIFPTSNINDAKVFSDEYLSTGGQVYLLATGCYRLVVDIRELVQTRKTSLCCHPYDLCTILIAEESGAVIFDGNGNPLSYPLDTATNCNWIGFTNRFLCNSYKDLLLESIKTVFLVK